MKICTVNIIEHIINPACLSFRYVYPGLMNCTGGAESFPSWNNKIKSLGIRVPEFLPAMSYS